jgi:hypothetical protein
MQVIRIAFPKIVVFNEYKTKLTPEKSSSSTYDPTEDDGIVSESTFYKLWNNYCSNISQARWKGEHCICNECKRHAHIDSNPRLSNKEKLESRLQFQEHLKTVAMSREAYSFRRQKAWDNPARFMSLIIDGTNQNMTVVPNIKEFSKSEESLRSSFL